MTDLSKDRAICEAATHGASGDLSIERHDVDCGYITYVVRGDRDEFARTDEATDRHARKKAAFIAHFNPARVMKLMEVVEAAMLVRDYLLVDSFIDTRQRANVTDFDAKLAAYLKGSE